MIIGPGRAGHPAGRHDLLPVPIAVVQHQVAQAGHVAGCHVQAAAGLVVAVGHLFPVNGPDADGVEEGLAGERNQVAACRLLQDGAQQDRRSGVVGPRLAGCPGHRLIQYELYGIGAQLRLADDVPLVLVGVLVLAPVDAIRHGQQVLEGHLLPTGVRTGHVALWEQL